MNEQRVFDKVSEFLRNEFTSRKATCVVIGLSGGIDSSVAAYVAAKALGPKKSPWFITPRLFSHPQN